MYMCVYMYVCVDIYTHRYIRIYIYTYMYTCVYIYRYRYIYVYIYFLVIGREHVLSSDYARLFFMGRSWPAAC
jgi:hypothetical protein